MIAVHNIKSMIAVPGAFDDSHYIMLEFAPDGTDERPVTLTLYFATRVLAPGQLAGLCEAINKFAPQPDLEPDLERYPGDRGDPTEGPIGPRFPDDPPA